MQLQGHMPDGRVWLNFLADDSGAEKTIQALGLYPGAWIVQLIS